MHLAFDIGNTLKSSVKLPVGASETSYQVYSSALAVSVAPNVGKEVVSSWVWAHRQRT